MTSPSTHIPAFVLPDRIENFVDRLEAFIGNGVVIGATFEDMVMRPAFQEAIVDGLTDKLAELLNSDDPEIQAELAQFPDAMAGLKADAAALVAFRALDFVDEYRAGRADGSASEAASLYNACVGFGSEFDDQTGLPEPHWLAQRVTLGHEGGHLIVRTAARPLETPHGGKIDLGAIEESFCDVLTHWYNTFNKNEPVQLRRAMPAMTDIWRNWRADRVMPEKPSIYDMTATSLMLFQRAQRGHKDVFEKCAQSRELLEKAAAIVAGTAHDFDLTPEDGRTLYPARPKVVTATRAAQYRLKELLAKS